MMSVNFIFILFPLRFSKQKAKDYLCNACAKRNLLTKQSPQEDKFMVNNELDF